MIHTVKRLSTSEYRGVPYIVAYNTSFEGYLAYIGILNDSISFTALIELMRNLDCHGGVTYPADPYCIKDDNRNHIFTEEEYEKYYWIGWDYMHYTDTYKDHVGDIVWTEAKVIADTHRTIDDLCILYPILISDTDIV